MRQKYYVHMGPRTAEEVSVFWKGAHLLLFVALCGVSVAGSYYIYSLLDSFNYNCILYAKLVFKKSGVNPNATVTTGNNGTTPSGGNGTANAANGTTSSPVDVTLSTIGTQTVLNKNQTHANVTTEDPYVDYDYLRNFQNEENRRKVEHFPEGTIAERSSTFATSHMCNLMLFPLITTTILALMLTVWVCLSARGGKGVPGDLMPYPWICIYPMIMLCGIMVIFSVITDRLFRRGCDAFCLNYKQFTGENECTDKINKFSAQFNNWVPRPWYQYYSMSYIFVKTHTVLWVCQLFLYIFRVFCLADFNIYITRIRQKGGDATRAFRRLSTKDLAMANLILQVMQSREKHKIKEERRQAHDKETEKSV